MPSAAARPRIVIQFGGIEPDDQNLVQSRTVADD